MILSLTVFVNAQDVTVTVDDGTGAFIVRNDKPDTLMVVDGKTGNVGIGINNPQERLHIHGDLLAIDLSNNHRGANIMAADEDSNIVNLFVQDTTGFLKTTNDAMDLVLGAGFWGDDIVIKANGKVGIGTMSPDEKLHIDGNMRLNGAFEDKDGDAGTVGQILSSSATGTNWINVATGSDDQKVDIFSISGNNVQLSVEDDGEATKTVDISTTTAVTANTAKTTNATHTGDVTGSGALTIGADKVLESHLKVVNTPTDEYALTYEETTGDFEWQAMSSGTDDQKINVFSVSGNNVQLSLEADGEATKTVDISSTTAVAANTAKNTNVSTALSAGTVTATTYGITSDGGANDIVLPEATTTTAGLLGADKWDEIVANTAKVTDDDDGVAEVYGAGWDDDGEAPTKNDVYDKIQNLSGGGTTYSIGDFAQGGIVFWVDETRQHGLVCAKTDQSSGMRWYAGTNGSTQAKGNGPFSGEANTTIIIAAQVALGDDEATYAARVCNELQITEGGKTYGDWYLPSKEELNLMYTNKATIDATATANSGVAFATRPYWSSTENDNLYAWQQYFNNGLQSNYYKYSTSYVRSVRAF